MYDKLTDFKEEENNKIIHFIEYEHYNKIKKIKKI